MARGWWRRSSSCPGASRSGASSATPRPSRSPACSSAARGSGSCAWTTPSTIWSRPARSPKRRRWRRPSTRRSWRPCSLASARRPEPSLPRHSPSPTTRAASSARPASSSEGRADVARIDLLFDALLQAGGSDLHLGVNYPPLMRQRGDLVAMRDEPLTQHEMEVLLFEIASPEQKKTIVDNLDLDFAYAYGDKARFRANYFYK